MAFAEQHGRGPQKIVFIMGYVHHPYFDPNLSSVTTYLFFLFCVRCLEQSQTQHDIFCVGGPSQTLCGSREILGARV